jgi:hypothetical protein
MGVAPISPEHSASENVIPVPVCAVYGLPLVFTAAKEWQALSRLAITSL